MKTINISDDLFDFMKCMKDNILTQNNRCTSDVYYGAQEKIKVFIECDCDSYFTPYEFVWCNERGEANEKESDTLDRWHDRNLGEVSSKSEWKKCYFFYKWRTVQTFLSEKEALDYIENKNREAWRTYGFSGYYNKEVKMIKRLFTEFKDELD